MASPGLLSEAVGQLAYAFSIVQPLLPTYIHMIVTTLCILFAGSHASLSRPLSAAKRRTGRSRRTVPRESTTPMEGLSPGDAVLYPLLTGGILTGLYYLIKYLNDPDVLNKIINWYLTIFGVFSISKFLADSWTVATSFFLPERYENDGKVWIVSQRERRAIPESPFAGEKSTFVERLSPLPGLLSQLPLPSTLRGWLWSFRRWLTRPVLVLDTYIRGIYDGEADLGIYGISSFIVAVTAVLYFNLIGKPWYLTNLLGLSFSYTALQLVSPTTFWTGTLVLSSLFFYDIYFVFFTPMMITVATKLDIPVKLLFPRPGDAEDPTKPSLALLGLGDIVLPGIMIGLALRFDLFIFYLKKQKRQQLEHVTRKDKLEDEDKTESKPDVLSISSTKPKMEKSEYLPATGSWGERFWMQSKAALEQEGGAFPKPYFYASIVGYVLGLVCTLTIMQIFKHGQPALLYLVPGVLLSLWGTAFVRGELKTMWEYSEMEEDPAEQKSNGDQLAKTLGKDGKHDDDRKETRKRPSESDPTKAVTAPGNPQPRRKPLHRPLIEFSLALIDPPSTDEQDTLEETGSKPGLDRAGQSGSGLRSITTDVSSTESPLTTPRSESASDDRIHEPPEKRRRTS